MQDKAIPSSLAGMSGSDAFRVISVRSDDGLNLYGRDYGPGGGDMMPVVCLAGLTRNSRDFHQFALLLAGKGRRVVTLDYRGRGMSERDPNPDNYTVGREALDVVTELDALGIDRAAFIGTSRGGLILHLLTGICPERIAAIILNDIGPVIEVDGLRKIRDYLSLPSEIPDFSAAAKHLRAVHGVDFPNLTAVDWDDMARAVYCQAEAGGLVADYDPALIKPLKSMDFSKPLPDLWPQFELMRQYPLMIVRGQYSSLLSRETVAGMLERHGSAEFTEAAGQGHAPILHVEGLATRLLSFLDR